MKYFTLGLLFFVACASEQLGPRDPSPARAVSAYESEQWRAAHAACGYASPCAAPDEAHRAVVAVRALWRGRVVDLAADARVDGWIESERRRQ